MSASLIRTLKWQTTDLSTNEHERHVRRVQNDCMRRLKSLRFVEAARLMSHLRLLSPSAQYRLFSAPEMHRVLTHRNQGRDQHLMRFLKSSIEAERYLEEGTPPSQHVWTARGDWYFPAGCSADLKERRLQKTWTAETIFHAPILEQSIAVDCYSPHARARFNAGLPNFVTFEKQEVDATLKKLSRAMNAIGAVSGEARTFVVLFLKQIVLRKTRTAIRWASFSTSECIGRTGLLNPQSQKYDWICLTSDLVHEAIHSWHYILDARMGLLPNPVPARRIKVKSPWTGNRISLYSYVSACFVWFGLANFWIRALETDIFPAHRIREQLILAATGFWSDDLSEVIKKAGWQKAPVNKIIREMQANIRALGTTRDH